MVLVTLAPPTRRSRRSLSSRRAELIQRRSGVFDPGTILGTTRVAARRAKRSSSVNRCCNLGVALEVLGERESGTVNLKDAIAVWDTCLTFKDPLGRKNGSSRCALDATKQS